MQTSYEQKPIHLILLTISIQTSPTPDIEFSYLKVVSHGESTGPASVILTLKKATNKETVQETKTVAGGDYVFEKVLPGEYVIEASREPWVFDVVCWCIMYAMAMSCHQSNCRQCSILSLRL